MRSDSGLKQVGGRPMLTPPALSPSQESALRQYGELLGHFNKKLNLVSRDSIRDVWDRHILHSLTLAYRNFRSESTVVDWGTGGGLPLVPLAVVFPEVNFVGVDSVEKKVMAVRRMVRQLGLQNVTLCASRAEVWEGTLDYSVSRATAPLATLWTWHRRARSAGRIEPVANGWPPGLICLKGGDLTAEIGDLKAAFVSTFVHTISLASLPGAVQFPGKDIVVVADADVADNPGS